MVMSPSDAISRETSSTLSGGRRLRISAASSCERVRSRTAALRTPDSELLAMCCCYLVRGCRYVFRQSSRSRATQPPLHEVGRRVRVLLHHVGDLPDDLLVPHR